MEEYLQKVMAQIRCAKAIPYIEKELRDHLEDQISANLSEGMEEETAVKEAVKDMGDPVETGILLDKVHKPQVAWHMILLVGVISFLGFMIHTLIQIQVRDNGDLDAAIAISSKQYLFFVAIGLVAMMAIYLLDYTVIARFSKIIGVFMILACIFAIPVNGAYHYIRIGSVLLSMPAIMLLYVPIYGGILYKYHGTGYKGFVCSILWMILPVVIVYRMPSLMTACLMLLSMLVMLTMAILKDWFKVSKKKTIIALWSVFILLPIASLATVFFGRLLAPYQRARILAFFSNSSEGSYLTNTTRNLFFHAKFIGGGQGNAIESIGYVNADYLLAYLTSTYGILAGIIVCCVITALIVLIFAVSKKQKNQLGMMMVLGCGMVFTVSLGINVLVNIGVFPPTWTFLPFLSANGNLILVSYALIGIVLSVYKYKSVYPTHVPVGILKSKS